MTSAAADAKGRIYFGTAGGGLVVYDGNQWKYFNQTDGLASNTINDLYVDKAGVVWIATNAGVTRYKP